MSKALKVFITYAHKNTEAKDKLITYLAVLKQNGLIDVWHDNEILPGDKWRDEIFSNLADSDILLYLTCPYSLASENCNEELTAALNPNIRVIPITLEHCDWQNHQLSKFQVLPDKGKPINEWQPESKGWQNVVDGIRKVINRMQSQADSSSVIHEKEVRAELAFQQGNIFMMFGQPDMAIEAYSHVIEINPRDIDAYINRGTAYQDKNNFDLAIQDFTTAIQLKPDYAIVYYKFGVTYGKKGEVDKAIENYNTAINKDPEFTDAYNSRGVIFSITGEVDKAIKDYNSAIQINPDYAKAYCNRGNAYSEKGCHDRVIEDYSRAIELNPDFAEAYCNRGHAYVYKGEIDNAIEDYNTAIKLRPKNSKAYVGRGNAYRYKGEVDKAIEDYNTAIKLNPDFSEAYENRGITLSIKGEHDLAIQDFSKVIQLQPQSTHTYYNRGATWLFLRQWKKAMADLTIARDRGVDITGNFRKTSMADFERAIGVKLPSYIAAMLTRQ